MHETRPATGSGESASVAGLKTRPPDPARCAEPGNDGPADPGAPDPADGRGAVGRGRAKPRVLVVDDDPVLRLMAGEALGDEFQVLEAANGLDALASFNRHGADLILLDVLMPGMDGFETCEAMRKDPGARYIPILMVTGLDDMEAVDRAYRSGASDFLTKPVNWQALRYHVHYMLRAASTAQALAKSEERYALAAQGANDGLWDWDLRTNRIQFSVRWKTALGYRDSDIGEDPEEWLALIHDADRGRVERDLREYHQAEGGTFSSEYRILDAAGGYRWVLCRGIAVRDEDGGPYRMVGSQTDVNQRKEVEARLQYDAMHDSLSGLPNRSLFLDRVEHALILRKRREESQFAVLFMDLDRFKNINDSLGHTIGDRLLVEVSRRIESHLRAADTLARLGGDEFALLLDDMNDVGVLTSLVERMQSAISKPFDLDGREVVTTCSIGITLSNKGYTSAHEMLRDADTAMYRAKRQGKARYALFDEAMHTYVVNFLETESMLRRALDQGHLRLAYQPIVELDGNRLGGFEALLRVWDGEKLLAPEAFLEVAEESGLIVPMGQWVTHEACRQLCTWQKEKSGLADCFVSVNLSSREFGNTDVLHTVDEALTASGVAPACLKLEITENVLIENHSRAREILARLRERGVRLSLDDFGTGYSSFNYLHHFPLDVLKIDRSFVRRLDQAANSRAIVNAIVALAHNLGLRVVAEGSETPEEVQQLRALGCDFVQGFAVSYPLDPETAFGFMEILERRGLLANEPPGVPSTGDAAGG